MAYQITITQTRTVKTMAGKEWTIIGTKEVPRDASYYRDDSNQPKTRIEEVRGYTPEIEKLQVQTVEVLKQQVDDLDLAAVIKAINKL